MLAMMIGAVGRVIGDVVYDVADKDNGDMPLQMKIGDVVGDSVGDVAVDVVGSDVGDDDWR